MREIGRIGVDIGGTFTDIVLFTDRGRTISRKTPSTPAHPEQAVLTGIRLALGDAGLEPGDIVTVLHGTTVGSNAILQKRGGRTGLVTTRGFRDVLEIGRLRTPGMFDLSWDKPEPLVPRHWRCEVTRAHRGGRVGDRAVRQRCSRRGSAPSSGTRASSRSRCVSSTPTGTRSRARGRGGAARCLSGDRGDDLGRGPARTTRIRANLDDRGECLCPAGAARLSGVAGKRPDGDGRDGAAFRQQFEWRAGACRAGAGEAGLLHFLRSRRGRCGRRRSRRAGSGCRISSPSTWAGPPLRRRWSRTASSAAPPSTNSAPASRRRAGSSRRAAT